jgi:hypothetical protein
VRSSSILRGGRILLDHIRDEIGEVFRGALIIFISLQALAVKEGGHLMILKKLFLRQVSGRK